MLRLPSARALALWLVFVLVPSVVSAQGPLTNGANHAGAIAAPAEIDEWTFTAGIGDSILLSVGEVLPAGPDPDFRPWIRVRRPDGVEIASNVGFLAVHVAVGAPLSGTYTVLVRDAIQSAHPGTALGSYQLQLVKVPGALVVGDQGGALTSGANDEGTIHVADLDAWTFTAAQNDAILLRIGEVLDSEIDPDFRPWIRLYSPTGVLLGSSAGFLSASIDVAAAPLSGTYTVVVADYIASAHEGSAQGDYLLHLVKVPGTQTVPTQDEGGTMVSGANHAGRIGAQGNRPLLHRGDLDTWTFTAAQNDAILLRIGEVLDSEVDPDFRPWIRLYSPTGVLLGSSAGFLSASVDVAAAPLSGTYTVVVADYIASAHEGSALGDYLLHLVKVPGSQTVPAGDEGGAMVSGANHAGRIGAQGDRPLLHRGDLDTWTFTAAQNDAILLRIGEVLDSEVDPDFRPWIRLYSPTGVLLGSSAGFLSASVDVAAAPLSGTYTVVVADYIASAHEGSALGDYLLHLVKVPGSQTVPAGDEGGPMSNGTSHSGRIGAQGANRALHRGDLDTWTFGATQGAALSIDITEVSIPSPDTDFRPWIRLYGPAGVLVGSSAGLITASINLNAPLTGTYTVVVSDAIQSAHEGSAVGDYTLSAFGITTVQPPTSQNDAYATAVNTTLNVPASGVLSNDNSNGGGAMTAQLVTTVAIGSLTLTANGGFAFTPPNGFTGTTSFTYRAVNSAGPGNIATVTITVTPGTPPTTVPDSYDAAIGTTLNVPAPGVLGNDSSNGHGALTAELMTAAASGIVTLNANGSLSYTPNAGFVGTDTFEYRAVSSVGAGNTATVSINVVGGPQPPTELYAAFISGNTVTLRFKPPTAGTAPTGYVLEGGVLPGEVLASIATGNTNPIYTLVAPTGSFYVRMHTIAGGEKSRASNEIRIHVNVPVAPSAPDNLTGMANGNTIALAWRNTFAGGAPGGVVLDVSGSLNASLPLGLTDNFQFVGVPTGSYTLSVRAINSAGSSPASNVLTMAFPSPTCVSPPQPPANFLAYRVGNAINVLWDPAATGGAPTGFTLGVTGGFNGSFATPGRTLSGVVGPGSYTLSVSAANACGVSTSTAPQTVIVP